MLHKAPPSLEFVHDNNYFASSVPGSLAGYGRGGGVAGLDAPEEGHPELRETTFAVQPNLQAGELAKYCHPGNPEIKFSHGTTTLAFVFDHGVLVAVDSRASMGSYIGSGTVKKVIPISPWLLGTMAGGAADCSFWERNLAEQCRLHKLREGKRISVAAASKRLANTLYSYKGYGLSMGTMIAGWDETKGPTLYHIDDDGTRLKGQRFAVGSGATYAYGILDSEFRPDLTVEEAVELGKRAIWHATHRDAASGGTINVFCIEEKGWTQHFAGDMNTLYYGQYAEEKKAQAAARAAASEEQKSTQMEDDE